MTPETLLKLLFIANGAITDEEKARVAWRFSDAMWRRMGEVPLGLCRAFNNLLQDQEWPWVKNLWEKDEVVADYKSIGWPDEVIAIVRGLSLTFRSRW